MEPNIFDKIHDVDLKKTMEDVLYRLCDERYRRPGTPGCARRLETGAETSALFDGRAE